jgi:hypothetical protein
LELELEVLEGLELFGEDVLLFPVVTFSLAWSLSFCIKPWEYIFSLPKVITIHKRMKKTFCLFIISNLEVLFI